MIIIQIGINPNKHYAKIFYAGLTASIASSLLLLVLCGCNQSVSLVNEMSFIRCHDTSLVYLKAILCLSWLGDNTVCECLRSYKLALILNAYLVEDKGEA